MVLTFSRKLLFCFFILFASLAIAQGKKFKVVLDAGHGGKDSGTQHNTYKEKAIVLKVALKVGKILESEPGFNVVYTRKTDVFIELRERANIANRAGANLFISIHCNGVNNKTPSGTETFVMGLSRSDTNLEIARKENSVITLEKDYKIKYKGFDPNSPETSIGITLAQEESRKQSIVLASKLRNGFKTGPKRFDRGVKQIPLWVLDATVMPGALIELGFLSNAKEGKYLNSDAGQNQMAKAIANAIISYKKQSFGNFGSYPAIAKNNAKPKSISKNTIANKSTVVKQKTVTKQKATVKSKDKSVITYKVQIATSRKQIALKSYNFKRLNTISRIQRGTYIRYYYGKTTDYAKAKKLLIQAKEKGYPSAFIVAFKGDKIIPIDKALE